jgi:cbb3-type cytochrome oxidase subunit 3
VTEDPPTVEAAPTTPGQPVNWRQEYLHLAVILMTACWMSSWVALSLNWFLNISLSSALGLSVVHLAGSMLLVRWLLHRGTEDNLQFTTVLLAMMVAAGVTVLLMPLLARAYGSNDRLALADLFYFDRKERVPAGPLVALLVMFLWWRGAAMGNTYITLVRASFGLRLGILSILLVALFADEELRVDMLAMVPFFFFFGLLGSSLARADSLNLDQPHDAVFGRGWMLSLLVIVLVVTGGGYLAALWLSGANTAQIADTLGTFGEVLATLLFLVASPLLLLAQLIFNVLKAAMPDQFGTPIERGSSNESPASQMQAPWLADLLTILSDALFIGLLIFIVLLLLAFIWFLFIARGERKHYHDEERESLGTSELVGGFGQTWRDGWRRLADLLGFLRRFGIGPDLFAALTIRRIYARMEKLARTRGYPRAIAETPSEYQRELLQAFPGQPEDIRRVTEAYIAVRYGEVPEDPAELQAVRVAWERLKASPDPG